MSKKTSIDWLIAELKTELGYGVDLGKSDQKILDDIINEAKEMHKEEIIQACYLQLQYTESELGDLFYKKVPEEIYNENFKQ